MQGANVCGWWHWLVCTCHITPAMARCNSLVRMEPTFILHVANRYYVSQAKAFALLSEEGIAKGVRRIVAVTAADANTAISAGEELAGQVAAAEKLPDAELEKALVGLKAAVDVAVSKGLCLAPSAFCVQVV